MLSKRSEHDYINEPSCDPGDDNEDDAEKGKASEHDAIQILRSKVVERRPEG